MRIIKIQAENFASYEYLEFDPSNKGLTLIQGPTGSGKSTLCDLVPWCLFGQTAKNGAVDEVLSWSGGVTTVKVSVSFCDHLITVVRIRGPKAKENDLFFLYGSVTPERGKDLNDTQKLINNLLGIDANLYLSGAYFHEFSTTAQFFTTTAKNRRLICEQIVDLSLAKTLQVKLSEDKKSKNKQLTEVISASRSIDAVLASLSKTITMQGNAIKIWQDNHENKKRELANKYDNFERVRKDLVSALTVKLALHPKCPSCGTKMDKEAHAKNIQIRINEEKTKENPYLDQLAALETETSPHAQQTDELEREYAAKAWQREELDTKHFKLCDDISDLETLEEVTDAYRGITIQNAIAFIEDNTNKLLTDYFDGEINVKFETSSNDKIEVMIAKDGNTCAYTQLSKGQRCLLKLCFGISIMQAVSNHSGINFSQIMIDEGLEGMDEALKIKAYRLLQYLATQYESVFVVEHSAELKNLFDNKISVQLVNGHSELSE